MCSAGAAYPMIEAARTTASLPGQVGALAVDDDGGDADGQAGEGEPGLERVQREGEDLPGADAVEQVVVQRDAADVRVVNGRRSRPIWTTATMSPTMNALVSRLSLTEAII